MQKDIESLIENVKQDRSIYAYNEANTKSAIINKFLDILGWDIHNPNEVEYEYGLLGKSVDYALKIEKNNRVFIEAKRIKEHLSEVHEVQLLTYAWTEDIELAILTNGIHWKFYLPLEGGGRKKKKFCEIDISQQDTKTIASRFTDLLHKNNVYSRKAVENATVMFNEKTKVIETVKSIQKTESFKVPTKESLSTKYNSLVDYNPIKKTISSFYFMNVQYQIEKWKDLLCETINIMYSRHKDEFEKILNVTGRSRIYFTHNPNDISSPSPIKDTNIYVDTKLSSKSILKLCIDVLYEFGYPISYFAIETLEDGIIGNIASAKPANIIKPEHIQKIQSPISAIPDTDVKGREKGERYGKYSEAVVPIVSWIKTHINSSDDGIVRVKVSDITKEMGSEFEKKNNTSIYWGLKYVLFKNDIVVDMSTHIDGGKLLVMRDKTIDDELPPSLAKYLEDEEYNSGDYPKYIVEKDNINDDIDVQDEQEKRSLGQKLVNTIKEEKEHEEDKDPKEKLKIDTYTDNNKIFCTNCGKSVSIDEKFCKYCGYEFEQKLSETRKNSYVQRDLKQREIDLKQREIDLKQREIDLKQKQKNVGKKRVEKEQYTQNFLEKRHEKGVWIRIKGALCYSLGFITGILFLLLEKDNEFVRFHATQSTVTFLSLFIITILLTGPIGSLIWILQLFVWLLLIYKSCRGEMYKLPIIGKVADSLEFYLWYK